MGMTPQFRDLVIRTILGESDGQPQAGQLGVANVIKNRIYSGAWGDPANGGGTRVLTARKQFSMWNQDDPKLKAYGDRIRAIPTSDPRYQRAAAVADQVFNDQVGDNTGGATHYYNPSVASPDWGNGPGQMIGAHKFMKLPLSAGTTAGTVDTHAPPATVQTAPAAPAAPPLAALPDAAKPAAIGAINRALADAHAFLGKNEVPDHDAIADYLKTGGQNLDPHQSAWCAAFVSASLQREGLPVPGKIVADSKFAGGANARDYLTYGQGVTDPSQVQAGDILVAKDGSHVGFAEGPVRQGPNGPEVQILAGNEADRSGKYQPGSWTNPDTGQVANRAQVGQVAERWAPLSDFAVRRAMPANTDAAGPASSAAPAAAASAPVPASNAQPASATAPGSSGGNFAVPPAGAAPGSDKYSVVQGMTTGTSHNPQLTTAANWGNLFGGGGSPSPPPAAAPAAVNPPSSQPASAPLPPVRPADAAPAAPINRNNPLPWQGPPQGPAMPTPWQTNTTDANNPLPWPAAGPGHVPNWGPWHIGSPTNPIIDAPPPSPPSPTLPNLDTTWKPAPTMTLPPNYQPPPDQTSSLPGSMLDSGRRLLAALFGTGIG